MTDIDYDFIMKELYNAKDCQLAKKFVTPEIAEKYKGVKTSFGGTLAHCVKPGAVFHNLDIGIYACDPEAYTTFREVFDEVIRDYHKMGPGEIKHPPPTFGQMDKLPFGDLDPDALKTFNDKDMKGTYYSLENMDDETRQKLIDDHFLFGSPNQLLMAAGAEKDWPKGRGIFLNHDKTFLTWINEEDHIRIISMQKGGNLAAVYQRLVKGIQHIEKTVKFVHDPRLGYLTCCPTNLGTSCRASVHLKIPNVAALKQFKGIVESLGLQPRGTAGEDTKSVGGVWDISNLRRLGYTELDALTELANGVKTLILLEQSLEAKEE